jgi:hypothetical protein
MFTNDMQGATQTAEKFALTLLYVSSRAQATSTEISFVFIRCPNSAVETAELSSCSTSQHVDVVQNCTAPRRNITDESNQVCDVTINCVSIMKPT